MSQTQPDARPPLLVTGGAGFIGSHVTDAFLALGHPVVVLDDLSTGDRARLVRWAPELALTARKKGGGN